MCGIVGGVSSKADINLERLHAMTDAINHRGPDDSGFLHNERVGFGHRRLSIIDLDSGQQPMQSDDGKVWIVFNGEIYNYQDLCADLQARHTFKTHSDTEVLLRLYEEHGEACLGYLRGMFAFAIYDHRCDKLFAARDHLGQKPFYYWAHDDGLMFSSEIKGLLAYEPSLRVMDAEALYEYLTVRIITPPRSMFKDIKKLPPAHYLVRQNGQLKIENYWSLDYTDKLSGDLPTVVNMLDEQVQQAVKYHLVSDVPVGSFLSGGLDSGLIVAAVNRVSGAGFNTFTGDVDYKTHSELPFAEQVARQYGCNNHVLSFKPSLVESLPQVLWHLDEPSDSLSVAMYYICKLARQHVKVVLGGDGGDELFGGYDRYYGNVYASYYALLPEVVRKQLVTRILDMFPDGSWYQSVAHQAKWINSIAFYEGAERYAKSLSYFYFSDSYKKALFTDEFLQQVGAFDPEASIKKYFDCAKADELIDRMLNSDSMVRMPDHPVMILDRMSMAHGLEARAPFLDNKLAEFCARIPVQMKVKGRTRRLIQVELAKKYLPAEVINRKKQGFASSITYMMEEEFKLIYRTFLRHSRLVEENYLNAGLVEQLLEEHLAQKSDHGQRLWLLCSAEIWYRLYIDGEGVDGISGILQRAA